MDVPKYSLCFSIISEITDPQLLPITSARLLPQDASLSPFLLGILENLGKEIAFRLGKEFEVTQIRFKYSPENGITLKCVNQKVQSICESLLLDESERLVALSFQEADKRHLTQLKKPIKVEEKDLEKARRDFGDDVMFFDRLGFELFISGVTAPTDVDLELSGRVIHRIAGRTTGHLRFPHMLQDLYTRFSEKVRSSKQTSVCIVGPGLFEDQNAPFCPQFTEVQTLFPNASYLLLDNDSHVLKILKKQLKAKAISYNPLMLRIYSTQFPKADEAMRKLYAPTKYQQMFQVMKQELAKKEMDSQGVKKMLDGEGKIQNLCVKVDRRKIQLRQFEIESSMFSSEDHGTFDVVVATMSILLALGDKIVANPSDNHFSTLLKFLRLLKVNGSLYVDAELMNKAFANVYGSEGMKIGTAYLEMELGNRLAVEEIPLSDFLPSEQGAAGFLKSYTVDERGEIKPTTVSSSSLVVYTRTAEKVNRQPEAREKIQYELLNLLKNK